MSSQQMEEDHDFHVPSEANVCSQEMDEPSFNIEETSLNLEPLNLASQSENDEQEQGVHQTDQLQVNVKKVNIARSNSAIKAGMPQYPMTAKPRGQALIIEIEKYENDVQDPRIGSHHDVNNLKELFSDYLGFEVTIKKDLIRTEFDQEINSFANSSKHKAGHMMILVVLSHGKDGHVFASDGRPVSMENLYQKFNNQFCPNLKGKPKFFIIQACRGDDVDKSLGDGPVWGEDTIPLRKRRMQGTDTDTIPFSNLSETNRARPTWEDMIIAYSTIPGYASVRDHEKGTWFIQSLVEVFRNHAHDKELIDLLRMTSERLSQFTNEQNEKQTCNIELRHLYKRIYFNPGVFDFDEISETSSPRPRRSAASPKTVRRSRSNPPDSPRRPQRDSFYNDDDETN